MDGVSMESILHGNERVRYIFRKSMSDFHCGWTRRPPPIWYVMYWENHPPSDEDVSWGIGMRMMPESNGFHMIEPESVRYEFFRSMMAYLLMTHDEMVVLYWLAYPLDSGDRDCQETAALLDVLKNFNAVPQI